MAITGIKAISSLGLNNIKQTVEKILLIKFISAKSSKTAHAINVEYTAKSVINKTATISLSSRKNFNKLTYEPLIGIVKNIKITKEKDNYSFLIPRNPFAPDELIDTNFIASIVCDGITAETSMFKLDLKTVTKKNSLKIVIDPGHGYTKGNTGAVCFIYTHKILGKNGEPILKENNEFKTETNDIIKLPDYVINNPNKWIISKKEDPNHNERILVYDVAVKLKELLEKNNYTCFITRNSRVVQGNDDAKTRKARIDLANNNKVDYFISIHADGATDYTSSGAHVIYPKTSDKVISENCKNFAKDIFTNYNVINVESTSPKEDIRGLQVLGNSNLTKRKVLVELGFVTTPKDAKLMFSNIDRIAIQLLEGIMININKNLK